MACPSPCTVGPGAAHGPPRAPTRPRAAPGPRGPARPPPRRTAVPGRVSAPGPGTRPRLPARPASTVFVAVSAVRTARSRMDPRVQRRADQRGERGARAHDDHRAVAVGLEAPGGRVAVVLDEGDLRRVGGQFPFGETVRPVLGGVPHAAGRVQPSYQRVHRRAFVVRQVAHEVVEFGRAVEVRSEPVEPLVGGPAAQRDVSSRTEHVHSVGGRHVQHVGLQFWSHRQPSDR